MSISASRSASDLLSIPNVGKATVADFHLLGINSPSDLTDKDPQELYDRLCNITGAVHDICVLDVFTAAINYVNDGIPVPWWEYSRERKARG
jgi:hypothetical protein